MKPLNDCEWGNEGRVRSPLASHPIHSNLSQLDVIKLIAEKTGCSLGEATRNLMRAANPSYRCKIVFDDAEHNARLSFITGDEYFVMAEEIV